MTNVSLELRERRWFLDPGALLPFVQSYTEHLADLGHAPWTVRGYTCPARHFAVWLCQIKQPEVWRFGFPLISHPGISI